MPMLLNCKCQTRLAAAAPAAAAATHDKVDAREDQDDPKAAHHGISQVRANQRCQIHRSLQHSSTVKPNTLFSILAACTSMHAFCCWLVL
jgi:hypothetical protein